MENRGAGGERGADEPSEKVRDGERGGVLREGAGEAREEAAGR